MLVSDELKDQMASEQEVRDVAAPDYTESWHPISHADFLDSLEKAAADFALPIVEKEYLLTYNGAPI